MNDPVLCDKCPAPAITFARDMMLRPNPIPGQEGEWLSKMMEPVKKGCAEHAVQSEVRAYSEPWPLGVRFEDLPSSFEDAKTLTPCDAPEGWE